MEIMGHHELAFTELEEKREKYPESISNKIIDEKFSDLGKSATSRNRKIRGNNQIHPKVAFTKT
jgi:hypothetical protein